ncbi:effector-associated constant component EACC1 [Rugosimonospora africana]|uniref:Uncharacterized protein n=1 Tax=Rugosimonospora africana TaxID=556532 RepID=A0A8J3QWQ5_9ACTN|nr:hypothetical protein [Rugosimonospora africana]GIH17213.1 hypothetical protein Raf01_53850 [Rugosimonospora africana]
MQIVLTTTAPAGGQELGSLYQALLQAPTLRAGAQLGTRQAPPQPGELGGTLEAIQLIVDGAFQMANLVVAIAGWRSTRNPPPSITIQVGARRAEVTSDRPEQIDRVVETLHDTDC